jgi:MOSC domain-containing protein YiiM
VVQSGLVRKGDPISKIATAKRAGSLIQAVELLPSKHEAKKQNKTKNSALEVRVFLDVDCKCLKREGR